MIYIREQKTKSCPGLTSLFLEFNYHPQIIEVIKQCDGSLYDKKNKLWETPIINLSFLLDHLSILDDISLELLQTNDSINSVQYEQNPNDQYTLFPYQKEGVEFGLRNDRWLLLDVPGLGKTLQIIKLAEELKKRDNIQHCLIICGLNTLKYNWKKEIGKFSNLQARVIGEHITKKGNIRTKSIADRVKELSEPLDEFFIIINIESLRNDDIIKVLNKGPNKFDMIAVDECHVCFVGDTLIQTDLGILPIQSIVENSLDVKIASYNHNNNKIEYKPILNTFKYNIDEPLVELMYNTSKGTEKVVCTKNHPIYTHNRGYVPAYLLDENDIIETIDF